MVEVFRTNVPDHESAGEIVTALQERFPGYDIHFDLEDCDKILRVESPQIFAEEIACFLKNKGFVCEVLS